MVIIRRELPRTGIVDLATQRKRGFSMPLPAPQLTRSLRGFQFFNLATTDSCGLRDRELLFCFDTHRPYEPRQLAR